MSTTYKVMTQAPIRNATGKLLMRQCKVNLHYVPRAPLNTLDPLDIEMRIRYNLRLIRLARGK